MSTPEQPPQQQFPPGQGPPPGWWMASDGRWYPPQGQPMMPPPTKKNRGCLWAALIVFAVLIGMGGLLTLGVVLLAAGSDDGSEEVSTVTTSEGSGEPTEEERLFPDRPDFKENDHERQVGQPAELSGYTATVTTASFKPQLSEFEREGYLVADVTLLNRDDEAQPYNLFEWKLITPGGTIIDPYFGGDQLGSGDLVSGGEISGQLVWDVEEETGVFYVIYDPLDFGDDRGVWQVTL